MMIIVIIAANLQNYLNNNWKNNKTIIPIIYKKSNLLKIKAKNFIFYFVYSKVMVIFANRKKENRHRKKGSDINSCRNSLFYILYKKH